MAALWLFSSLLAHLYPVALRFDEFFHQISKAPQITNGNLILVVLLVESNTMWIYISIKDRDLLESCQNNSDTKGSFIQQLMRRKYSKFLLYVATLGIKLYGHFGDLAKDVMYF